MPFELRRTLPDELRRILISYVAPWWATWHPYELCRTLNPGWATPHPNELCRTLTSYATSFWVMPHLDELRHILMSYAAPWFMSYTASLWVLPHLDELQHTLMSYTSLSFELHAVPWWAALHPNDLRHSLKRVFSLYIAWDDSLGKRVPVSREAELGQLEARAQAAHLERLLYRARLQSRYIIIILDIQ